MLCSEVTESISSITPKYLKHNTNTDGSDHVYYYLLLIPKTKYHYEKTHNFKSKKKSFLVPSTFFFFMVTYQYMSVCHNEC